MDKDELLTVTEVAKSLRVSRMTIYRLVESGEVESFRVGRQIRIRASSVSKYLKARNS